MDNESNYVPDESYTESDKDDLTQSNEKNEADAKFDLSSASEEPNTEEERVEDSFITEIGSGWYEAPGIGTFYDAGNGWIYEPNLGWSFLKTCPSNCSAWLFNENLGWLWFDSELPNMTFANNNGSPSWIFYPESTFGQSDLVFDYTQNSWMEWK